MTNYRYNITTPNAPNDPADDQPQMQQNTASIAGLIQEDHVGFGFPNGGYHKVIHLVPQTSDPTPPGSFGQIYSKQIVSVNDDEALFYETGGSRVIQMTCNVVPVNSSNGFSFLPGGLLFQWGTTPAISGNITYPQPFSANAYNVQLTLRATGVTSNSRVTYAIGVQGSNQCSYFINASNILVNNIFWTAIGPA